MFEIRGSKKVTSITHSLYFKKDGCERGYAHFTLVPDLGIVHAQTDWGDYSYRWGCIGEDTLEEFLLDLDKYYVGIKFCGKPKELDEENTLASLIKDIFELRRQRLIDKSVARELYGAVVDLDMDVSVDTFCAEFPPMVLNKVYDYDYSAVPLHRKYSSWQQTFIDDIFPTFQEYLKREVATDEKANRQL